MTGIKLQGELSERAYEAKLAREGVSSFDLNKLTGGQNFPLFDNISERGLASVKTNVKEAVALVYDLQSPTDWEASRLKTNLDQAANLIAENAGELQRLGVWPKHWSPNADAAQIRADMKENSKIAVCTDQESVLKQQIADWCWRGSDYGIGRRRCWR